VESNPLKRRSHVRGVDARMLTQQSNDHRRHGLVKLEHDIADEAVADDDVEGAALARTGR